MNELTLKIECKDADEFFNLLEVLNAQTKITGLRVRDYEHLIQLCSFLKSFTLNSWWWKIG